MSNYLWIDKAAARYLDPTAWLDQTTGTAGASAPSDGDIVNVIGVPAVTTTPTPTLDFAAGSPAVLIYLYPDQPARTPATDTGYALNNQTLNLNGTAGPIRLWAERTTLTNTTLNVVGTVQLSGYLSNAIGGTINVGTATAPAFFQYVGYGTDPAYARPDQPPVTSLSANITVATGSTFDAQLNQTTFQAVAGGYIVVPAPDALISDGLITIDPGGTFNVDDTNGAGTPFAATNGPVFGNNGTLTLLGAAGRTTTGRITADVIGAGRIVVNGQGAAPSATTLTLNGSVIGQSITLLDGTIRVNDPGAAYLDPAMPGFDVSGGSFTFGDAHGRLELHQSRLSNFTFNAGDAAPTWQRTGRTPFATTIAGFQAGDTIAVITADSSGAYTLAFDALTGVLDVLGKPDAFGNAPVDAELRFAPGYNGGDFHLTYQVTPTASVSNEVDLTYDAPAPCFAAGTLIGAAAGEVPVEVLRAGDLVRLAAGGMAAVIWAGGRSVDCAGHPDPGAVWPVRVAAHAFGPDAPRRDLLLSPDHAVFADGCLIPVRVLINGLTIRQERRERIAYYHLELARHDVILAEGLAVESFLDTGNRDQLTPVGAGGPPHPVFAASRAWEALGCAPLVIVGPAVDAVARRLSEAAGLRAAA